MPQVIKIKRGTTVPTAAALTDGELGLNKTAPGDLYAGDGTGVLALVSATRQVEIAGAQTITGAKTIDVANLKVPGGLAAGDILTTTDPVTGILAFVTPTVAATTDWEEDADMDIATPVRTEFVNAANVRFLVGGQLATLNTLDKTAVIPAINSLKAEVDLLATGAKFVGTYDASTGDANFTAASGATDGPLPAPAPANAGWYVVNEVPGVDPPSAPTGDYGPGDWVISDGTAWTHLDFSAAAGGTILASGVTVGPAVNGGDDVQEVLTSLDADITAIETSLPLTYEPIIAAGTATHLWQGNKTWIDPLLLPPTTAQIAIDGGQDTLIAANAAAIALLPTDAEIAAAYEPIIAPDAAPVATQYWSGLKTWLPLPAVTVDEPPITAGLPTDVWQGDKTWVPKLGLPISTATQAALDLKEPLIALGVAGQYLDGAAKAWVALPAGSAPPVADGVSITGAGVAGDPFVVGVVDAGTY